MLNDVYVQLDNKLVCIAEWAIDAVINSKGVAARGMLSNYYGLTEKEKAKVRAYCLLKYDTNFNVVLNQLCKMAYHHSIAQMYN